MGIAEKSVDLQISTWSSVQISVTTKNRAGTVVKTERLEIMNRESNCHHVVFVILSKSKPFIMFQCCFFFIDALAGIWWRTLCLFWGKWAHEDQRTALYLLLLTTYFVNLYCVSDYISLLKRASSARVTTQWNFTKNSCVLETFFVHQTLSIPSSTWIMLILQMLGY